MSILDSFGKEINVSCTRLKRSTIYNQTTGSTVESFTADLAFDSFKFSKSMAEKYFNAEFRPEVSEVLVLKPNYTLIETDRVSVTDNRGVHEFVIDSIEDIGNQGEVMLVGVKKA